jgi:hypothetical protein
MGQTVRYGLIAKKSVQSFQCYQQSMLRHALLQGGVMNPIFMIRPKDVGRDTPELAIRCLAVKKSNCHLFPQKSLHFSQIE